MTKFRLLSFSRVIFTGVFEGQKALVLAMVCFIMPGNSANAANADLSISLTASPNPVVVNGALTFRLDVLNSGPAKAQNITVTDILPTNTQYVSASPGCKPTKYKKINKGQVTCKLKKLGPGLASAWTIVVKPIAQGDIKNRVILKSSTSDRNKKNNSSFGAAQALLTVNQQPVASSASLRVDSSTTLNVSAQLIATDADQDTLTYELLAPPSGGGYTQAAINAQTGMFTVSVTGGFSGKLTFPFRATDGKAFSNTAAVTIDASPNPLGPNGKGSNDIDPTVYAEYVSSRLSSDLLGAPGGAPSEPPSVDLTAEFPSPGDQGSQGSCVGWATAYALKSYQEGREMGWPLDTSSHLYSPAYIYNQINGGMDNGSKIDDALQLIVTQGAASLATTPYNQSDYLSQPSNAARTEAAQFKALRWAKVDGTNAIKSALVNRQPVAIGFTACDAFQRLSVGNPVYNTFGGSNCGGHAVTIVGYDNNRYGGAFKVINSWGTNWGDNGYFWFPYSFTGQALKYAYVLEDKENIVNPNPPSTPPPSNNLPNLAIQSWSADYDPVPGGAGSLQWRVINSGTGNAAPGAYVNLMLSTNDRISSNDIYVVYEKIQGDTLPGESWFRDSTNAIAFNFPDYLDPGEYFMALWVDDLDSVLESNEADNVSFASTKPTISAGLPDLYVNTWNANWDSAGNGTLTYEIANHGGLATPTGWDVNLVLSPNRVIGDNDEYYLFFETIPYSLAPGYIQYRNSSNPANFNLYVSQRGNVVPNGTYYMAVWVDDTNRVVEADGSNNASLSANTISIGAGSTALSTPKDSMAQFKIGETTTSLSSKGGSLYNGKELPMGRVLAMQKVKISTAADGTRKMEVVTAPSRKTGDAPVFSKTAHSDNQMIFPITNAQPMPSLGKMSNGR